MPSSRCLPALSDLALRPAFWAGCAALLLHAVVWGASADAAPVRDATAAAGARVGNAPVVVAASTLSPSASPAQAAAKRIRNVATDSTDGAPRTLELRPGWRQAFASRGLAGVMVLTRVGRRTVLVSDVERAQRRLVPASTFKIANALIALETGAIKDEFEPVQPEGTLEGPMVRTHTLVSALRSSSVPTFQTLAKRVGPQQMQGWLKRLSFGNADIGNDLTAFWLDGSLQVSALEELSFLDRLYRLNLPMSERSQRIVRDALTVEANACWRIRAKTGWAPRELPAGVAWWVGTVETDKGAWVFAMNIDIAGQRNPKVFEQLNARREIVMDLLREEGVIPARCDPAS
jgi:beta-lactamase class D